MSKPNSPEESSTWLQFAEDDLHTAGLFESDPAVAPRYVCFHAQQAAEKALKAVLIEVKLSFPYSHDLELLLRLLPDDCDLKSDHPDLSMLTGWAVDSRYPRNIPGPTSEDARDAVEKATVVVAAVRADLQKRRNTTESPCELEQI